MPEVYTTPDPPPPADADGRLPPDAGPSPLDELKAAAGNLAEVAAYAQQFVAGKVGGVLYSVRKLVLLAVLGLIAGVSGIAVLVTCAVLLVIGLAEMLAAPLPEAWEWLGYVVVGGGGVLVSLLAAYLIVRRAAAAGRTAAAQAYRESLQRQRDLFGVDAMERAARRERATGVDSRPGPADGSPDPRPPGVLGDTEDLQTG